MSVQPNSSNEVVIEHPEVPGAIMRIPKEQFDPNVHKEWDTDVDPWMDGSGNPLPDAAPQADAPSGGSSKRSRRGRVADTEES